MSASIQFQFEPDLSFQQEAIAAVCDVFEGQTQSAAPFTVLAPASPQMTLGSAADHDIGTGNSLDLTDDALLRNLRRVQLRHGLPPTEAVDRNHIDLTVEMETGTGKTYVYLRTIYELNKRYGFTKFLIVVPSIAIKEGVNASIKQMKAHFAALYGNPPFHHFVYDSSSMNDVRSFATSAGIEVMVATIQGLHKTDLTLFHQATEKLGGAKPIELIQQVRPVVIVDEPQSVEGGKAGKGREAIDEMHPLATLRYSATHADAYDMVFRLDAVDAYERKLVKGIEVASTQIEGAHDQPYVRVVSVDKKGKTFSARLELDCAGGPSGVRRKVVTVRKDDPLQLLTGRSVYDGIRVVEFYRYRKDKRVLLALPGDEQWLAEGQTYGDVPMETLHREMIRRTIRQHLTRERDLTSRGIKVLTLFFLHSVSQYRSYDDDGNPVPGPIARIFEQEYERARRHPDFKSLFDERDLPPVDEVHNGYFSIDRNRRTNEERWVETIERNKNGQAAAAEAYALIMKEKGRLLSLDTPLRFIFSHSALREGWDNPNVFQICSLREMSTERQRRQSIGRGLRLCVNQDGVRVRDPSINRLTVIATESVSEFAARLQEEIEAETHISFGKVDKHSFAHMAVADPDDVNAEPEPIGVERSEELFKWLVSHKYITRTGKVEERLKRDLDNDDFEVPEAFAEHAAPIVKLLRKLTRHIEVNDADAARRVRVNKEVLDSPEFRALWDRIKHKTVYQVSFDADALVQTCIDRMASPTFLPARARTTVRIGDLGVSRAGIESQNERLLESRSVAAGPDLALPDVLTDLQDATGLTRRSIARILTESGALTQFRLSPQSFTKAAADLINRARREQLIEGVRYSRLGESDYYALSLFESQELLGYLDHNTVPCSKGPYEHIVYDSAGIERPFAQFLESTKPVKYYVKLPSWFQIPTPLGTYNPDWAVVVDGEEGDRLYFVVETKGSLDSLDLRGTEGAKIHCGTRHFEALASGPDLASEAEPARYVWATDGETFTRHWDA